MYMRHAEASFISVEFILQDNYFDGEIFKTTAEIEAEIVSKGQQKQESSAPKTLYRKYSQKHSTIFKWTYTLISNDSMMKENLKILINVCKPELL